MQMPPFMRHSNFGALSLARWQYDLLMDWVADVTAPRRDVRGRGGPRPLSADAAERRRRVLATLPADAADGVPGPDGAPAVDARPAPEGGGS